MAAQSTTTTAAFALGVLALAPGGGSTTSRGGSGGGGGGGGGVCGGGGLGLVGAFVGHTAIRAVATGQGSDGVSTRYNGRSGGGYLNALPSRNMSPAAFSFPAMTLKSGPRPTSSTSTSSSSGGGVGGVVGGGGGGGRGVKRRVSRSAGFGSYDEDFKYVAAIKGGVVGFLEAMDQSLSGELVTVVTFLPWCRSCHHLRHRLRVLAEAHALAGSGAMFYEIDLNANPEVHKMLDIHAAPTVLLYSSGQLVDEFTCAGDSGPRVMLKHIEEQVGSIPDPWHRLPSGPSPESPTPGTYSSVPAPEDDA